MALPSWQHHKHCLGIIIIIIIIINLRQDYSKTRAWIWMKCCVSTDVGTSTNWLTFEGATENGRPENGRPENGRPKKDERTETAGLKMQDQMSGGENAGPENAGPENQDRDWENGGPTVRACVLQRKYAWLCSWKNAVVKQSQSTQCNTMSNTQSQLLHYVINYFRNR